MSERLSIDELAAAAGLSRRAVRFYVQQKLLPAPLGAGRGRHYDQGHLEQLRRVQELQAGGYSLDAIRRILAGQDVPPPDSPGRRRSRSAGTIDLWTRLKVAEGIELHLDVRRFEPNLKQLSAVRDWLRAAFGLAPATTEPGEEGQPDHPAQ